MFATPIVQHTSPTEESFFDVMFPQTEEAKLDRLRKRLREMRDQEDKAKQNKSIQIIPYDPPQRHKQPHSTSPQVRAKLGNKISNLRIVNNLKEEETFLRQSKKPAKVDIFDMLSGNVPITPKSDDPARRIEVPEREAFLNFSKEKHVEMQKKVEEERKAENDPELQFFTSMIPVPKDKPSTKQKLLKRMEANSKKNGKSIRPSSMSVYKGAAF